MLTWDTFVAWHQDQGTLYLFQRMEKGYALVDEGGYMMDRQEFEQRVQDCREFYEQESVDEIIDTHNRQCTTPLLHKSKSGKVPVGHPGYVYLMQSRDAYKIGKSVAPDRRLTEISSLIPHPMRLVHTIRTDNMTSLERALHARFADKRLEGEWFALTPDDIEYVKGL